MSETEYPTMSSQLSSSVTPGLEEEVEVMSSSLHTTLNSLNKAHNRLSSTQIELQYTVQRLQDNLEGEGVITRDNGAHASTSGEAGGTNKNAYNAYTALQKAQEEIKQLRSSFEEAQTCLEERGRQLDSSLQEYQRVQNMLEGSQNKLAHAETNTKQLQQNRRSLLFELQSTKEVLISSLNKVHDLELESQKVPFLQQRVQELERRIANRRYDLKGLVRPLSTIDSGLYSTDSTDSEHEDKSRIEGASDDESFSLRGALPPRPPSYRARDKSPRSNTPSSAANCEKSPRSNTPSSGASEKSPRSNTSSSGASEKSPRSNTPSSDKSLRSNTSSSEKWARSNTPSSGHHSAGSKLSSSSMQSQICSPESGGEKLEEAEKEKKGEQTETMTKGEPVLARLRREIEHIKKKFGQAEQDWIQERAGLVGELTRRRDDFSEICCDLQVMEAERFRLSLLEEKIKEVLTMLRTLNNMVFKFLNSLYHSTREYERVAADAMLERALSAVEGEDEGSESSSSEDLSNIPEGMNTIRPRRVTIDKPNQTFSIDV